MPLMAWAQDGNSFFQRTRLIFAGDVMQHSLPLEEAKREDGTYSYSHWYRHITKEIKSNDIATDKSRICS